MTISATISGNVGQDGEVRQAGGTDIMTFTVASNSRGKGGDKTTTWVRCSMFGNRGTAIVDYVKRGKFVVASGTLEMREYEGRDGVMKSSLEMRVNELDFAPSGNRDDSSGEAAPRTGGQRPAGGGGYNRGASGNGRSAGARPPAPPADAGGPANDGYGAAGGDPDGDIPFICPAAGWMRP